jgi:hypothetical protein
VVTGEGLAPGVTVAPPPGTGVADAAGVAVADGVFEDAGWPPSAASFPPQALRRSARATAAER